MAEGEPGPPVDQPGEREHVDVGQEFREAALGWIDPTAIEPMKVVLDGGNGMAGPMVGPVLNQLPLDQVPTYWEPDGNFPDHEPNPLLEENRRFIIEKVRDAGAELGIAWDGDADRCFFIDETGTFVDGDFLCALLAEAVLAKEPGAAILYDVRASRAVRDRVEAAGGTAHVNRVGPRLLQDPHARRGRGLRRRGLGPLLLPRLLQRRLRHAARAAGPRAALLAGRDAWASCSSRCAPTTSSRARSTPRSHDQEAKMNEIWPSATPTPSCPGSTACRSTTRTGTSTCGPPTPSPCCGSTWSRCVSAEHMEEKRDEVLELIRS